MPGVTEHLLWKDEHLVFKVGGKMFVILLVGGPFQGAFSFKTDSSTFRDLVEMPGIIPTPYLARHHWVRMDPKVCRIESAQIEGLLRRSYHHVVSGLPKRIQQSLAAPMAREKSGSAKHAGKRR